MIGIRRPWVAGGILAGLLLATGMSSSISAEKEKNAADEKAAREKSATNLRQLALAMHNYNDTYNHLPPAALHDKGGKALLSWRVAILPFVEAERLHKEFRLDEPWDSAHNKKLLAKMPKIYAPVLGKPKQPHSTYYQVFTGEGAFGGKFPPRIPASFPDGTSNTLLIVEGGEAVPWTKPVDLDYQPKMALPKLGGQFKGGFYGALADGSARFCDTKKISEQTLRAAITPDGNDVLGADWAY